MSLVEYSETRSETIEKLWEGLVAFRMMEDLSPVEKSVIDAAKYIMYDYYMAADPDLARHIGVVVDESE